MPTMIPHLFLTFVLTLAPLAFAHAAKPDPSPETVTSPSTNESQTLQDANVHATIDIAQPPESALGKDQKITDYFYPFRRAITFRTGYGIKGYGPQELANTFVVFGTQFLYQTENRELYEFGADLVSDGSGTLHVSHRKVFSRGAFRPYAKLGGGIKVIPKEQLATFLRFEHYHLRAAAGFEALVYESQSVRLEIETSINAQTANGIFSFGYVVAW